MIIYTKKHTPIIFLRGFVTTKNENDKKTLTRIFSPYLFLNPFYGNLI